LQSSNLRRCIVTPLLAVLPIRASFLVSLVFVVSGVSVSTLSYGVEGE